MNRIAGYEKAHRAVLDSQQNLSTAKRTYVQALERSHLDQVLRAVLRAVNAQDSHLEFAFPNNSQEGFCQVTDEGIFRYSGAPSKYRDDGKAKADWLRTQGIIATLVTDDKKGIVIDIEPPKAEAREHLKPAYTKVLMAKLEDSGEYRQAGAKTQAKLVEEKVTNEVKRAFDARRR